MVVFHSVIHILLKETLGKKARVLNSLDSHVTFMLSSAVPGPRLAWSDLGSGGELALGGISQLSGFTRWEWFLVRMPVNVGKRSVLWSQSRDSKPGTGKEMDHLMHTRPLRDSDSNNSSRDYMTGSVKGSHNWTRIRLYTLMLVYANAKESFKSVAQGSLPGPVQS